MIFNSDQTPRFQPFHRLVIALPGLLGLVAIAPPASSAEVCEPIAIADSWIVPPFNGSDLARNVPGATGFPEFNYSSNLQPSVAYNPPLPPGVEAAIARQDYDAIGPLLSHLTRFNQADTLIQIAHRDGFQGDRARLLNDALTIARSLPPDQPLPSDSARDFLIVGIFFAAFAADEVELALQALQEHSRREQQVEILTRVVDEPRQQGNWEAVNAVEDRLYALLTAQPDYRAVGLSQVAALYTQAQQPEKSQRTFAEAIALISAVEPGDREEAVMQRVSADLIAAGELAQAEEMMQILQDPAERQLDMAIALAERGQYRASVDRVSLIDAANPIQRTPELIRLLTERGQLNCAQQVAMLSDLIPTYLPSANLDLALALAKAERDLEALALLGYWHHNQTWMEPLPALTALVSAGEVDLAHDWALALPNPSDRLQFLAALSQVLNQTGDFDRASTVLTQAEQAALEALRAPMTVYPSLPQFMVPPVALPSLAPDPMATPEPASPASAPFPSLPASAPVPSLPTWSETEQQRSLEPVSPEPVNDLTRERDRAKHDRAKHDRVFPDPSGDRSSTTIANSADTLFEQVPPAPQIQRLRQISASRILAPAYEASGQSQVAIAQLAGALQLVLAPQPSQALEDFDGSYESVPLLQQYAQLSNPPLGPLLNLRQQIRSEQTNSTQTRRLGDVAYGLALSDAPEEALATLPFADCSVFVQRAIVLSFARQQQVEQALELAAQMSLGRYDRLVMGTWVELVGIFATTGRTEAAERVMTEILDQQHGDPPYLSTTERQRYGEQRLYDYAQRLILAAGAPAYSYSEYFVPDFQDLAATLPPQVQDLIALAEIAITNGDADQALTVVRALPSDRDRGRSLAHLAIALHGANQAALAETALAEADAIAQNLPNHFGKVQALLDISDARLQMGQPDRAVAPLDQAAEILQ